MKLKDLWEYSMGIQGKDSNAKNKVDEPENDTPGEELKGDELEQQIDKEELDKNNKALQQNIKRVGAMTGQKVAAPQYAKGATQAQQGKRPTGAALDQMMGMNAQFNKALTNPKTKNIIMRALQTANDQDIDESTLAKKILNKLTGKKPLSLRKRSKLLKEADPKLFEINFNRKEIAQQGLDAPVKCGFEAETFFYSVEDGSSSDDVDNMSISDVEYEHGDLPDSAYSDYNDWIMEKAMDEYLPDLIDNWIEENRDEDEFIQDFMDSGAGPTEEGVEEYKENFKEDDPNEFENREEDGWDDDNWARDLINEEYEDDYEDFLRDIANEDDQLRDDAVHECEGEYSMDDWVNDQWYSMSAFLDDYGYEYYSGSNSVEGVASELYKGWIEDNSKFDDYPEYGEYGSTGTTTRWSVETDSSIDPDEGAGAELISPVFASPRQMLEEMKSLFEWSKGEFGTNNSTGLHITMSWQGPGRGGVDVSEPNKLKMALLLGDEYLLDVFGRLRNSYTKSQYRNVLKYAEELDTGNLTNFSKLEKALTKGISSDKFSSINFKNQRDSESDNELIEFRIAGGRDYNEMYKEVVQACVRFGTIMKAGYDDDAFRKEYIKAVSRVLRKSKEIDPKTAKEFDEINSPVVDSAKEIVGKRDYFDVLKALESSLRYFSQYEDAIDPEADKKWKQSVEDYEKGTGRKVGANLKEEEITGYIEPSAIPPSQYAQSYLEKAQKYFGKAMAMLARNVAGGTVKSMPKAKNIADFRKYASQLKLDVANLETILLQGIDDANYIQDNEKQKVKVLQKGIRALFKKDIIGDADYFDPQDYDPIADGLWQFFQSDDFNDNTKVDKLADMIMDVNHKLEKDQITVTLRELSKKRQKNQMYRYLKDGGYGVQATLFRPGMLSDKKAIEDLKKFLSAYDGYDHPTSRMHHVNIRSDDRYENVFQMNLIQKMRTRLHTIRDMDENDEKTKELKRKLINIGQEFIEKLKPDEDFEFENKDFGVVDGVDYLSSDNSLNGWNNRLDRIAKVQGQIDDADEATYNFVASFDDFVLDGISLDQFYYRKNNYGIPKDNYLKSLIKNRFAAIKKFLSEFDKIFQNQGFANMAKEIAGKNTLDRRNKDFEKNIRDNAKAKLNIPSHAWVYIKKDYYETITDNSRAAYLDNLLDEFNDPKQSDRVWVIPSAHWGQADDALNGLKLIADMERNDNYYSSWRKTGYNKLLSKFARVHSIPFKELVYSDDRTYFQMGGDEYAKLQELGIEITRKGDSRAGMPGQDYLIDPEELQNPISGEPIDRGSAMMWNQSDDEEKEMKRFKAFDWSVYPEKMKGLVAKELKGMKKKDGYYSLQAAMSSIIDQINAGKIDLALGRENNVAGMAQAAGVEDLGNASSNMVSNRTNWSNLADYLKIEKGVDGQGVNLLKKVYDQYDSDHNWRPEDPKAIGVKRWAAAVKAAVEYIQKNYTVSAGNYFRKDADGNAGDDQSGFDVTTDDYARMREKYRMFNAMMNNGIGIYILQSDVNRLVAFLKNPDNDELFKQAVLNRLISDQENSQEPNDFQGALARGRIDLQNNESIMKDKDLLEGFPKDKFGMTDYEKIAKFINKYSGIESVKLLYLIMDEFDVDIHQARDAVKSIEMHKLMPSMKEGEVSHSFDRRRAQKGKDKYHKVIPDDDIPVSRKISPGNRFDKVIVVPNEKGNVGHLVGMIKDQAEDIGSAQIDLAYALADAYTRGGFSSRPLHKLENINTKSMDSILEKFENLSLEKQLEIIRNDKLMESLADLEFARRKRKQAQNQKYKKEMVTIWDNQPWPLSGSWSDMDLKKAGFKRFSKGWKISKDKYDAIANQQKRKYKMESLQATELLVKAKKLSENLPNTNKIDTIRSILSKEFPVGDLDIQFKAYLALPIPKMMTDFSRLHSAMGHNADARDIVRHYVKNRMPEDDVKKLKLNEAAQVFIVYKDGSAISKHASKKDADRTAAMLSVPGASSKIEVRGPVDDPRQAKAEKDKFNYVGHDDDKKPDMYLSKIKNEAECCPRTKAKTCSCESVKSLSEAQETIKAMCEFEHSDGNVKGLVYLKQEAGKPTKIYGSFTGLEPGLHGFHIHEFGDLSKGCESAGAHYNPDGVDHGDLVKGHVGDLENVKADESGKAQFKIIAERVDLSGDRSVVGRALVIHADEDDLGKGGDEESLKTGNAGDRLACGVIRLMSLEEDAVIYENDKALKRKYQGREFFKRQEMPQIKQKHLEDPAFTQKFDLETKKGILGLDKITPSQIDRVPGLSDSAKKFFAKGQKVAPFIIDRNGKLVNGHHRYDAAKALGVKRVPIIAVNRTIQELVAMFGPESDFNMASKSGEVDARKVKGFKGLKPVDVDPRSVAAQKGWSTRRQNMRKRGGQQELPLDFGNDKDIRNDLESDSEK